MFWFYGYLTFSGFPGSLSKKRFNSPRSPLFVLIRFQGWKITNSFLFHVVKVFSFLKEEESREASTVPMSSPDTPQLLDKCLSFLSMGVWVEIISGVVLGPEISWRSGKVSSGMDCYTVLFPLPNKAVSHPVKALNTGRAIALNGPSL